MEKGIKRALLIDDDPIFNWLSGKLIGKLDSQRIINSFSNGLDALLFLKASYSPNDSYKVLLDIHMPCMNGWEFLEALEDTEGLKRQENLSIFIVSSSIDFMDMQRADNCQSVKAYFNKPLSSEDFRVMLGEE